ncbi:MAG: hypothetical protein QM724_03835 [Flavobacteriales bacterium]
MKRIVTSIRVLSLAFALVLLGTSCTKEEVVAPVAPATTGHGVAKGACTPPPPDPNTVNNGATPTTSSKTSPSNISDDGDNQGDRERGRPKRFR